MKENEKMCLAKVLRHEGGYSNHPKDPGGATMKGVIQRVYDAFRKEKGLPVRSVKSITEDEIAAIYDKNYWDKIRGDDLPSGVDYCIFDGAVNSGPGQATKWAQRAVKVGVDGVMGQVTVDAIKVRNPREVIDNICDQRLAFLRRLDHYPTFKKGWEARVADVRKIAKQMTVRGPVEEPKRMEAEETAKAPASTTKTTETPAGNVATKTTTFGIGGALLWALEKFETLSGKVSELSGMSPTVASYVLGALVVMAFGGILTFGVLAILDVIRRKARGEEVEAS
jgi:lysozyme family protein